ncbi:MAG: hypothetical protein JNL58_30565 [Planctomyces sp.]|nr:hypothetical protein [Planctomyces sp.]
MYKIDLKARYYGIMPALYWVDIGVLPAAGIELATKIAHSSDFSPRHRFVHFVILLRSLGFQHPSVLSTIMRFLTSDNVELQGTAIAEIRAAARREFLQTHPGEISKLSEVDRQALLSAVSSIQDVRCSPFKLAVRANLGDPLVFEEALLLAKNIPPDRSMEERDLEWYIQSRLYTISISILEKREPSSRARIKTS